MNMNDKPILESIVLLYESASFPVFLLTDIFGLIWSNSLGKIILSDMEVAASFSSVFSVEDIEKIKTTVIKNKQNTFFDDSAGFFAAPISFFPYSQEDGNSCILSIVHNFGEPSISLSHFNHLVSAGIYRIRESLDSFYPHIKKVSEMAEKKKMHEVKASLNYVLHNNFRIIKFIDSLFNYTQLSKKNIKLGCKPIKLSSLIDVIFAAVSEIIDGQNIKFTLDNSTENIVVDGVEDLIVIGIFSLLSNAFIYCGEAPSVCLSLRRSGKNAVISVNDNGKGIPEGTIPNLFSSPEELLKSNYLIPNFPLGITLSNTIAKKHGGNLVILSGENGTNVNLSLPILSRITPLMLKQNSEDYTRNKLSLLYIYFSDLYLDLL